MASRFAPTEPTLQRMSSSPQSIAYNELELRQREEKTRFEEKVNRRRSALLERHRLEKKQYWSEHSSDVISLISDDESPTVSIGASQERQATGGRVSRLMLTHTERISSAHPSLPSSSMAPSTPNPPKGLKRVIDLSDSDLGEDNITSVESPTPLAAAHVAKKARGNVRSIPLPIPQQTPRHAFRAATPPTVTTTAVLPSTPASRDIPLSTPARPNPKKTVRMPNPPLPSYQSVFGSRTSGSRAAKAQALNRITTLTKIGGANADTDKDADYEGDNDDHELEAENHSTTSSDTPTPRQLTRNMREISITPIPNTPCPTNIYTRDKHLRDRAMGDRILSRKRNELATTMDQTADDESDETASLLARFKGRRPRCRVEGEAIVQVEE